MKKKFVIVMCAFLFIISSLDTSALTVAPHPIRIDLGDGLVFYMLHDWIVSNTEELPEVGGLYRDGVLVYTFDDWLFWDRLYFSDDGMSFLAIPPRPWGFIRFSKMALC